MKTSFNNNLISQIVSENIKIVPGIKKLNDLSVKYENNSYNIKLKLVPNEELSNILDLAKISQKMIYNSIMKSLQCEPNEIVVNVDMVPSTNVTRKITKTIKVK